MVSKEHHTPVTEFAGMANRTDGIGAALRVMCPACHEPLPDDVMMLIKMLDAVPDRVSALGSARQPRP